MEFANVGAHCSAPLCGQKDFLPFTCDACHRPYCLEHRTYASHACTLARGKDHRAIVCPLCAKTIHLADGEDVNAQFERHTATDCAPESRKARVAAKPRCVAPSCKERLSLSNRLECPQCRQQTCMAHRHVDDHACPGRRGGTGLFSRLLSPAVAAPAPAPARPRTSQPQRPPDPDNTLRGTAARRMRPEDAASRGIAPPAPAFAASLLAASGGGRGGEVCPQCGLGFGTVGELVEHVEAAHASAAAAAAAAAVGLPSSLLERGDGGAEQCPRCGARFESLALLVRHAELHDRPPAADPPACCAAPPPRGSDWHAASSAQDSFCAVS